MVEGLGLDDEATLAEARAMQPRKYLVYLSWVSVNCTLSLEPVHLIVLLSLKSWSSRRVDGAAFRSSQLGLLCVLCGMRTLVGA